jgi:hypothetical protein
VPRFSAVVCVLLSFLSLSFAKGQPANSGQSAPPVTTPASDSTAITLAQQSVSALSGGQPIGDVTLNANVVAIPGSAEENGTATFQAKGTTESRVDLSLGNDSRSETRNTVNGFPAGAWLANSASPTASAQHNCWTDAAWFFPALSSLGQTANPNFIFKYIGQEQSGSLNTQHIRVFQVIPNDSSGLPLSQQLSTMDFYLDPASHLPLKIIFNLHLDTDENTNIPVEVDFANYQPVSGVQVPFHFQRLFNGSLLVDASVTSVSFNTGLADSVFTLQ